MCGTWTRALLAVTVTGVALVAPSAQPLLLSGDSRAEGSNAHGAHVPQLGSGSTFTPEQ